MKTVEPSPQVNLINAPEILSKEMERISSFLNKQGLQWYFQNGFALYLHGLSSRDVTDLDIRVDCSLKELLVAAKEIYPEAYLREPVKFTRGEFRNHCLVVPFWKTRIDITSKLATYVKEDEITYNIPFDNHKEFAVYNGIKVPICSLGNLLLYKLVHRRGASEGKNDLSEARWIVEQLCSEGSGSSGGT